MTASVAAGHRHRWAYAGDMTRGLRCSCGAQRCASGKCQNAAVATYAIRSPSRPAMFAKSQRCELHPLPTKWAPEHDAAMAQALAGRLDDIAALDDLGYLCARRREESSPHRRNAAACDRCGRSLRILRMDCARCGAHNTVDLRRFFSCGLGCERQRARLAAIVPPQAKAKRVLNSHFSQEFCSRHCHDAAAREVFSTASHLERDRRWLKRNGELLRKATRSLRRRSA